MTIWGQIGLTGVVGLLVVFLWAKLGGAHLAKDWVAMAWGAAAILSLLAAFVGTLGAIWTVR